MVLENIIEFWSGRNSLQAWRDFTHLCYPLQPVSASVERAFSIFKFMYLEQQSLEVIDRVLIMVTVVLAGLIYLHDLCNV